MIDVKSAWTSFWQWLSPASTPPPPAVLPFHYAPSPELEKAAHSAVADFEAAVARIHVDGGDIMEQVRLYEEAVVLHHKAYEAMCTWTDAVWGASP